MRITASLITSATFGLLALVATGASAAPLGQSLADLKAAANTTTAVEPVRYRCWWHRGHRHCGHVAPIYSYYYARPVVSLYYGPRYRRWY